MIDFSGLDLYKLKGDEKTAAVVKLFEIKNSANSLQIDKFKALGILADEADRRAKTFQNQRQIYLAEQHDLQIHALEQFKHTRVVRFMEKYGHEVAKGFMSPDAAKEWKRIEVKAGNGCYTFAEDGITVYERECQSCPKIGCKYHPDADK